MMNLDDLIKLAPGILDLFRLDGKVALVIGGTRGLGQAMAIAMASAGADVCIVGRGPAGLEETAEAVQQIGRKGSYFAADAADEDLVQEMVAHVLDTHGTIDILVNSQGIGRLEPTVEYDTDAWQRVMDTNVKSLFLSCKHVAPVMLEKGWGRIINISSVRGFQGRAQDPAYATSKGAVNQLTHSLAIEWGPKGINVNAIAPAFTRTALAAPTLENPEKRAWVLGRIPMGRVGEVTDFFGPVIFLASEASSFVNGHVLLVDGGWVAA